jgi:hypothetical protein
VRKKILIAVTAVAVAGAGALVAATGTALAGSSPTSSGPAVVDDSSLHPKTTTVGGATVLPTDRTVAHFHETANNPHNGVTYGYNMVGSDPFTCTGSGCSTTVVADIVPIRVNLGGFTFDGSAVKDAVLASPVFANNSYASTTAATNASGAKGAGGALSNDNANTQLEDATMRSQFNRVANSDPYHLLLTPSVQPTVTINVPANHGVVLQGRRGAIFADVDVVWWSSQLQGIMNSSSFMDPTHLPIFLTDAVMLYDGKDPSNCCIIGYHGASKVTGNGGGSTNSNGNAVVQTFAWASYVPSNLFGDWALQDIHALSHEIAEWADDPFTNNGVEPWLTPTAPQYGCTDVLETGDPVVGIGFAEGTNAFRQSVNNADGAYHPEDEVFLPWFMRTKPNTISEPTQSASANIGRYTLMGDLNPFDGFRMPATGC